MMKRFILSTLLAITSGPLLAGVNQWTSLGPEGGPVHSLAIDPQNAATAYALAGGLLFRSTTAGASWTSTPVIADSWTTSASALAIDPKNSGTVYVGGSGAIAKTTDGGRTWSAVNVGLQGDPSVSS